MLPARVPGRCRSCRPETSGRVIPRESKRHSPSQAVIVIGVPDRSSLPLVRLVGIVLAIKAGTERAKRDKFELLIHGREGQIRQRNSFSHDPRNINE
ncbi:DUF2188 domain-containing protein [Cupriavidus plantarum]|uniref:DUF2188 domain-containing protein n=1 Tax=Cupriavidus plantarum TaxID=942865 RepID=UPI0038B3FFA7